MKLITKRDLIRSVGARWREQYFPNDGPCPLDAVKISGKTTRQIADELDAINPETATAADVVAIIGNTSWVELQCDECGNQVACVVVVGQDLDYGRHTALLCAKCVDKAADLMP